MALRLSSASYLVVLFFTSVILQEGGFVEGSSSSSSDVASCYTNYLGDGKCDTGNNNEACSYDAGDCCSCTCVDGVFYVCDESPFDCVDPDASCVSDNDDGPFHVDGSDGVLDGGTVAATTPPDHGCVDTFLSDGYCNWANNNEKCDYDGGDCCPCTCIDTEFYVCGDSGYDCIDPAPCTEPSSTSAVNKRVPTPVRSQIIVACGAAVIASAFSL